MTQEITKIKSGQLFTVSSGEYSDYQVIGVFQANADFDVKELLEAYLLEFPKQAQRFRFDAQGYLGWCARKNLFEPVESLEWHLGDYGNSSEMFLKATAEAKP
jgi:hypothetical protein